MTDLRQGVSAGTHAVLDAFDGRQPEWCGVYNFAEQLRMAYARTSTALYANNPKHCRDYVIEAAARLLDVVDKLDREIAEIAGSLS